MDTIPMAGRAALTDAQWAVLAPLLPKGTNLLHIPEPALRAAAWQQPYSGGQKLQVELSRVCTKATVHTTVVIRSTDEPWTREPCR